MPKPLVLRDTWDILVSPGHQTLYRLVHDVQVAQKFMMFPLSIDHLEAPQPQRFFHSRLFQQLHELFAQIFDLAPSDIRVLKTTRNPPFFIVLHIFVPILKFAYVYTQSYPPLDPDLGCV